MSLWEKTARVFDQEEGEGIDWVTFGPILLLCSFSLSSLYTFRLDLFCVALLGYILSSFLQLRGCVYALILLIISSLFHHFLSPKDHLWQIGLEFSVGCSLFITALAFEEKKSKRASIQSLLATKDQAMEHLEQDLASYNLEMSQERMGFQEKVAQLQKELDETSQELSSILILNDVLRKKTAKSHLELKDLSCEKAGLEFNMAHLQQKLNCAVEELLFIKNHEEVLSKNQQLLDELNEARLLLEQTNMDFAHTKHQFEVEKIKVVDAEDQVAAIFSEKELLDSKLKEKEKELEEIANQWATLAKEREVHRNHLKTLEKVSIERNFLKERLDQAMLEMTTLKQNQEDATLQSLEKEKLREHLDQVMLEMTALKESREEAFQKLQELEKKGLQNDHLKGVDNLYKQLKVQFEEKTGVLEQTRKELFHTKTALETILMAKEESELLFDPHLAKSYFQEMEELERELDLYEEENRELITLITKLSSETGLKQKKK